ncbi:hypothetical protein Thiosp_03666 [Thiorhodovibrio litoralis]|nr:hypothetical protein Thiosp_03666 [Thiorhodovibrio litoralis]
MQIAINQPNDFVEMQTVSAIEREMRASCALVLFKAGRTGDLAESRRTRRYNAL